MSAINELERYAKTRHRHMGRGELMECDAGLGRRIVAVLHEHDVEENELDELVYEAVGQETVRPVNEQVRRLGQECAIASGEAKAAEINNGGFKVQVDFLMREWGAEALLGEVRGLLRPATPTP